MTRQTQPAPDEASLYQAALDHLARYATTEANLRRVLAGKLDRWARAQADPEAAASLLANARAAIDGIIGRLIQAGALSDEVFAENRAKSLVRGGRSSRGVQARLIAKGVAPETARAALDSAPETELAAALVLARKRRIGPYRAVESIDATNRIKELGVLARAGFPRDVAGQALAISREEADRRIFELRQ